MFFTSLEAKGDFFLSKKDDKHKAYDFLPSQLFICEILSSLKCLCLLETVEFLYTKDINPLFKNFSSSWLLPLDLMWDVFRSGEHFINIK